MVTPARWRRWVTVLVALAMCAVAALLSIRHTVPDTTRAELAGHFRFQQIPVNTAPAGARSGRAVEPSLTGIGSWISAVGAAVALADLRGLGHPADVCLVDPRDDSVTLRPAPAGGGTPYAPVTLRPTPLPYDATMAPMGCVPADMNEDGRPDLLVYYWGRSPVIFLNHTAPGAPPSAGGFTPSELVTPMQVWNTTALNVGDVDGSGHLGVFVGNYFPDGAHVLDPSRTDESRMQMQDGMGYAHNAGPSRLLLTTPTGIPGTAPRVRDVSADLPDGALHDWTLAAGLQDLTGDGLPSIYLANDFGPDTLLVNRSRPGRVHFDAVTATRDLTTPKSQVLGHDSFKGMGVTFTYPGGTGLPSIAVSNITDDFALQESNLFFVPTGGAADVAAGRVPYRNDSEGAGLSRGGWSWDVKAGDFDNSGSDALLQATGFVRGSADRWPELQELAMGNGDLLRYPAVWPHVGPGDDLSGTRDHNRFWVRDAEGHYTDLDGDLGLTQPGVSRGVALGDVDGDGRLDAVVANQWADSTLLLNRGPARPGADVRLVVPGAAGGDVPAVGATVEAPPVGGLPGQKYQLYPANGHAGASGPDLGLAVPADGRLPIEVRWRDAGGLHRARTVVGPGRQLVRLTPDGEAFRS